MRRASFQSRITGGSRRPGGRDPLRGSLSTHEGDFEPRKSPDGDYGACGTTGRGHFAAADGSARGVAPPDRRNDSGASTPPDVSRRLRRGTRGDRTAGADAGG